MSFLVQCSLSYIRILESILHFAFAVVSMSKFISYPKNSNIIILEERLETVKKNSRRKKDFHNIKDLIYTKSGSEKDLQ